MFKKIFYQLSNYIFMIRQLKFNRIKSLKTEFFINIINLSKLNDKLFSIITSLLALLFQAVRYIYFFVNIIKIISMPI